MSFAPIRDEWMIPERARAFGWEASIPRDKVAYASALRRGQAEPKTPHASVEKIDASLRAVDARADALRLAISQAEQEIGHLIRSRREEWIHSIDGQATEAEQAYRDSIEALCRARAEWSSLLVLRSWLTEYPNQGYKSGAGTVPIKAMMNRYPIPFEAVIEGSMPQERKQAPQPMYIRDAGDSSGVFSAGR